MRLAVALLESPVFSANFFGYGSDFSSSMGNHGWRECTDIRRERHTPMPDSSETGETGRDRTHTSRESRAAPPFRDEPS
jgi:hypothetical protein